MKKLAIVTAALLMSTLGVLAADEVQIIGTYQLRVGCYETYHEEISFVAQPGKDKFSAIRHALNIPPALKKELRPGMKIRVTGKKQAMVKKKLTKAQIRKDMYQCLKNGKGLPYECKGMAAIIGKIAKKGQPKADAGHDHGELELKPVDDDDEIVEVRIVAHITVTKIDVLK